MNIQNPIDYIQIERALLGNIIIEELSTIERQIYEREKPAFDIGRMAERAAQGYYAHSAAIEVIKNPNSKNLLTNIQPNQPVPIETICRKDGSKHIFDSHYYLQYLRNPETMSDLTKIWLIGSLLTIGDALSKHHYFDKNPQLELLYHLRNGVAHGNKFNINKKGIERLAKYPAHNKNALVRVSGADFEITPALNGKCVLFDFMGAGDVLDLLQSIGLHLMMLRNRLGR